MRPLPTIDGAGRAAALVGLALLALTGCAGPLAELGPPTLRDGGHLEVVLINGGHRAKSNGAAHMEHLRRFLVHLDRAEIPRSQVTVFASDGDDPTPDLAVDETSEHDWLLEGTRFSGLLSTRTTLVNSTLGDVRLLPARTAALKTWFHLRGSSLRAGDTLVLYVTDHGKRDTIQLWGEPLKVSTLKAMLKGLAPGVRVLTLMSQCYAGSFARISLEDDGLKDSCGYFSTLADRRAYGCYRHVPDTPDGHAFRLMEALHHTDDLARAHRRIRWTDRTPDVPISTSELYASGLTAARARGQRIDPDTLAWSLVDDATKREITGLLESFGLTLSDAPSWLTETRRRLRQRRQRISSLATAWQQRQHILARQIAEQASREDPSLVTLKTRGASATADTRVRVVEALVQLLTRLPEQRDALQRAHAQVETARALRYRAEVRLAAIARARTLLHTVAGERLATEVPAQAARLVALRRCEGRRLGTSTQGDADASPPTPFEDVAVDDAAIDAMRPPHTQRPRRGEPKAHSRVGTPAPSVAELTFTHGIRPPSDRPVLYVFWATWCKPCKQAFPALRAYAEARDLALVAVSREAPAKVEGFLASWTGWAPEVMAHDHRGKVSRAFDVQALPTFVLVGSDGAIEAHRRGMPGDGDLRLP